MSLASQKRPPFSADFGRRKRWKSAAAWSEENVGFCAVVTLSFGKRFLTKATGVLEHYREGAGSSWISIFGGVLF